MRPKRLFDTELGGAAGGMSGSGLGAMVEHVLGLELAKEHSAVDWSMRPLPEPWLRYAALDVEMLVDLRDALEAELLAQGKLEWAPRSSTRCSTSPAPPARSTRGGGRPGCTRSAGGAARHRAGAVAVAGPDRPAA